MPCAFAAALVEMFDAATGVRLALFAGPFAVLVVVLVVELTAATEDGSPVDAAALDTLPRSVAMMRSPSPGSRLTISGTAQTIRATSV